MLYLYEGFYGDAGGWVQPGSPEGPADKVCGISEDGYCTGILRCGEIGEECHWTPGIFPDAPGCCG